MTKGRRRRAFALLATLTLVGCGGEKPGSSPTAEVPSRGGIIVLGSISDVDAWNEYLSQQSFAANLLRRIYLRLAAEQPEGAAESHRPLLAEGWSFSDDGLALTFRLREAAWSDGEPITAADVRFTWEAQRAAGVPWVAVSSKERITDVAVVDERTVTFRFDRRYPDQLADAVEGGILPEHVFGEVPFDAWSTHDWSDAAAVGSGPFLLARHEPGHEIVLERNLRYFRRDLPRADRVVVRIVPDASTLLTQLLAGDVDYVEGIAPGDAARLVDDPRVELVAFDYPQFDFIGWNLARAPFGDPQVRRALTLAIDRNELVEQLLHGYGRVSRGPVLSFRFGADATLAPWPYDPSAASRLLAARGFGPAGRPLAIELLTNAGNRLREEVLVKIQEQLRRVGVVATIRPLEMRAMRQRVIAGDYDAYLGGWVFSGKLDLAPIFGSGAVPPAGSNVVHYASLDVDRALEAYAAADSRDERLAPLRALQRRIHEDQPYTFLYETRRVAGHAKRLGGVWIDLPSDPLARLEEFWTREP